MFVRKIIHDNGDHENIYKLPDNRLVSFREPDPKAAKIAADTYRAIMANAKEMRERDRLRD